MKSHGNPHKLNSVTTAALLIASAQAPLGSTLIAVALPSISNGIVADLILITSLLVTSYLVVNVACLGPAGKISDLVGHSRILWIGICLYVLGALFGLVAQGVVLLIASRCTMALAGAMVVPATLALLRLHVPEDRRGRVFGIFGATMGLAAAAGPALGGEIVNLFGWRAIFLANLPFLILAAIMLCTNPIPATPTAAGRSFRSLAGFLDMRGILLLVISLMLFITSAKAGGAYLLALLLGAIVAGVAFVVWETKAKEPVLDLRLFKLPSFTAGTGIIALQNFAMYGMLFQLPQFFSVFRGVPPREIGYMLFVMMIGMVIAAPVGGRLSDHLGPRIAAMFGVVPLLTGILMLCRLASMEFPSDALLALLLFGLGMGLCSAPAQSSSMAAVEPGQAGMAAGVSSTMRYLGGISSILVLGFVLGNDSAVSADRHELMIWLFATAIALSAMATLRLPNKRTSETLRS